MAVLGEGRAFALSCGRLGSDPERLTLFHVKLTDTAIKAFEVHQASKHSLSSQPTIRFGGSKGVMKIPVPKSECLSGLRCFSFDVSSAGRDGPQASLECIKQYTDSHGSCQLDCLGSVQDKITVCATDDSYQMTRERMTQAEEETRSRGVIEIKPGGPFLGKRTVRKLPASTLDLAPGRKRSMPVNVAGALRKGVAAAAPPSAPSSVSQRSYRERVMHLLALKPYKKPELLLRLQRDGVNQRDKMQLSPVLAQVAVLNAKDNTFTLRDSLYRELQKDWPGYSEEERQLMQRLVARKSSGLQSSQSQNSPAMVEPLARLSPVKDSQASTPQQQKRALPAEFVDPKASKKQRVSHLTSRVPPTFNGHANNKPAGPPGISKPHRPIPTPGNAYTTARPGSDGGGAGAESAKRRCDSSFTAVSRPDEGGERNVSKTPAEGSCQVSSSSAVKTSPPGGDASGEPLSAKATGHRTATGLRTDDVCVANKESSKCQAERTLVVKDNAATREGASKLAELASDAAAAAAAATAAAVARSRKKAKKNRDRERRKDEDARSLAEAREDIENIKEEMDLNPKGNEGDTETDMALNVTTSTADVPDYVLNYKPIASPEQRQSYKNDFNAEYEEYRELHARIENVTKHFVQLDAELRKLQPSTEEYKSVQDQVLKEYKQIKKINPNFREQKHRCQYLHHKLAHIKHLIMEYDQTSVAVW